MFYRTFITSDGNYQYSIDDLYNGIIPQNIQEATVYKTVRVEHVPESWYRYKSQIVNRIKSICDNTEGLDMSYTTYLHPKSKGGYRTISAPNAYLKSVQRQLLQVLKYCGAEAHDAAYAYVENRTCKHAIMKHQQANTKWFYKFDLSNFFPSCTTSIIKNMMQTVYPFFLLDDDIQDAVIRISTLDGCLPQGSPLSPMLCNMIMMSFDWAMYYSIRHFKGVYTRYADDIVISLPNKKDIRFIEKIIEGHLVDGLSLNKEKSRCGSINGHNFNLGLILNKDKQITLGHEKKMRLKAKLNNFIFDFTNQNYWSIIDTQVLLGEVNYFKQIEPEYADFVIKRLETKHNTRLSFSQMCTSIITSRV